MTTNQSVTRFQRVLNALPGAVRKPLQGEVFGQASELASAIRDEAPGGATGALAGSVRVEQSARTVMRALVRAGGAATTRGGYDYALAQEFGTAKQSAQPFFWPTYRANRFKIRRRLKEVATHAIGRIVVLS